MCSCITAPSKAAATGRWWKAKRSSSRSSRAPRVCWPKTSTYSDRREKEAAAVGLAPSRRLLFGGQRAPGQAGGRQPRPAKTFGPVVVDEASGLHEGVADGRADETE